jgi:hypothetical protein
MSKILKASYMNQKDAKKQLNNLGYTYDNNLSTNESKVFSDAKGKPHIAFRGTHRIKDIISDGMLGLGLEKYNKRFQDAKKLTKIVEDTYKQPANVFGHSLGGSLAEKSGAHGLIRTYNKGAGIGDIGRTIQNRQTDFRTSDDLVSALSATQKHAHNNFKELPTYGQNYFSAHNVNQFA